MNILLSNDDGYNSTGLKSLSSSLDNYGSVFVVAPHRDISASSSCLSVHSPVKVLKISKNSYKVYGTPADCVHIATRGILKKYPDIVFSGLNFGSNMGDDVIYSGTVGAAVEGRHARYGSYAISIASKNPQYTSDLDLKVKLVLDLVFSKLKTYKAIFNINIPDLPASRIKGIKISTLGTRKISKRAKKNICTKNIQYEIGDVGRGLLTKGSDFYYVHHGYISVTPIMIDMCNKLLLSKLKHRI